LIDAVGFGGEALFYAYIHISLVLIPIRDCANCDLLIGEVEFGEEVLFKIHMYGTSISI